MIINFQKIKKLIDSGYVSVQKHPNENLFILNYTKKASLEKAWEKEVLEARGLIINSHGLVVAKSFNKFFDVNNFDTKNKENIKIHEKIDGSLGILYWIGNHPFIATKRSFNSYQSLIANKILYSKYKNYFDILNKKLTYVFEIVSSENRVVVDYSEQEDIILIGLFDVDTGIEIDIDNSNSFPFKIATEFSETFLQYNKIAELEELEGFVIKFNTGERVKLRTDWYKQKHQLFRQYKVDLVNCLLGIEKSPFNIRTISKYDVEYIRYIIQKCNRLYNYLKNNKLKLPSDPNQDVISINDTNDVVSLECTHNKNLLVEFKRNFLSSQYYPLNY